MKPGRLLIRADADAKIGTGHVMRCIALAQEWQKLGGTVSLATKLLPDKLAALLASEAIEILQIDEKSPDYLQTVNVANALKVQCVVLDGYGFGAEHQRALRNAGIRQLLIDDFGHTDSYCADFVLNANLGASPAIYDSRDSATTLLLGSRFAMLRRDFAEFRNWTREFPDKAHRLLVSMGGADPQNVTAVVLKALSELKQGHLHIRTIVGPANLHRPELESIARSSRHQIELVISPEMPELMMWADLAISAAGTTCYELMFTRLPFIAVAIADNQRRTAHALEEAGIARVQFWPEQFQATRLAQMAEELIENPDLRKLQAERGAKMIDGLGAQRLAKILNSGLVLRNAEQTDCKLIWEWSNDPVTRSVSFSTAPIGWDEHVRWYEMRLKDVNSVMWIAETQESVPQGLVRFAIEQESASISVNLSPVCRGKGIGSDLIEIGTERLLSEFPKVRTIDAYIKQDNERSVHAFEKCGFEKTTDILINGHASLHYVLHR